jgi:hypothetical protein
LYACQHDSFRTLELGHGRHEGCAHVHSKTKTSTVL